MITILKQSLSLPPSYLTLLNLSLNEDSDLHIQSKYGTINLNAISCQMNCSRHVFLATYDYDESMPEPDGQSRGPRHTAKSVRFFDITSILPPDIVRQSIFECRRNDSGL